MSTVRKRLGEMLIDAGVIDETQLNAALGHQKQWGGRLGQALVDLRLATEPQIVEALAVKFGFEPARIDALQPYALAQALKLVPREFAVKNNVFPMAADTSTITIAMSDPANVTVADELRFRTGRKVRICIGGDRAISEAVRTHYATGGEVQAIALDLDGGEPGEPVMDAFGGGSRDALEAFFGAPHAAAADALEPGPTARSGAGPRKDPSLELELEDARSPKRPAPGSEVEAARAQLLGTVPHAGFGEDAEEITAVPIDDLITPGPQPLALPAPPAAPPSPGEEREEEGVAERGLSPAELRILDALDRLAHGDDAQATLVKPDQAMAAVVRLLIRKRLITETEFVEELLRK